MQNGINFGDWINDVSNVSTMIESMEIAVNSTSISWIAIYLYWFQQNTSSTIIYQDPKYTVSDQDFEHLIQTAKSLNLGIMIKPHIQLTCLVIDKPAQCNNTWRGKIGTDPPFTDNQWDAWFNSYQTFIIHYATIASKYNVEQIAIGTELPSTSTQENHWINIINNIRNIYSGKLTFASHPSAMNKTWWNHLDYIGIDAYMPLDTVDSVPTINQFNQGWIDNAPGNVTYFESLSTEYNRNIIFTEIGYPSTTYCGKQPYEQDSQNVSQKCQANAYQSVFDTFYSNKSWFSGIYWWSWNANNYKGICGQNPNDLSLCFRDKAAQYIVNKTYTIFNET